MPEVPAAWIQWGDFLTSVVTVLGVPSGIFVYWNQKRWERRQREVDAHTAAHQTYVDYLALTLDHPEADAAEYVEGEEEAEELGLPVAQLTLFCVLISALETAYLQYRDQPSDVQQSQWLGWLQYLQWWFRREDFKSAWPLLSDQFHRDFVSVGNRLLAGEDPESLLSRRRQAL